MEHKQTEASDRGAQSQKTVVVVGDTFSSSVHPAVIAAALLGGALTAKTAHLGIKNEIICIVAVRLDVSIVTSVRWKKKKRATYWIIQKILSGSFKWPMQS